jgi:hypothetical protein
MKGKVIAIGVHEVFDTDPSELRQQKSRSRERFQSSIDHYMAGDWLEAQTELALLLGEQPDDRPLQWWLRYVQKELLLQSRLSVPPQSRKCRNPNG